MQITAALTGLAIPAMVFSVTVLAVDGARRAVAHIKYQAVLTALRQTRLQIVCADDHPLNKRRA